jgi:hypothetical protein
MIGMISANTRLIPATVNRSRTSLVSLKSDAAAEKSKDQLSRDFLGSLDFRLLQNIGTFRTWRDIRVDNLDMPRHCHKTFICHPDGDFVESAAAGRERCGHRYCRATG